MTVVLDTNIWISAFIGKRLAGLGEQLRHHQLEILTSEAQVAELFAVLDRPKFSAYFSDQDKQFIRHFFLRVSRPVPIFQRVKLCRDPKDDFLLEIAINGKADFLVTGDQDLLVLARIGSTTIINYKDFEAALPR